MKQHWKKLVIAVVALIVVVVAGSFIYAKFINKADEEFDSGDVKELLDATTTVAPEQPVATDPASTEGSSSETTAAPTTVAGVDGEWVIAAGSEVGYRVDESINGFDTTANGRTQAITGTFTIGGTAVSAGQFTVDMTTFKSDESRRDGQFNGRIMDVANFPTATFVLTAPIDFQQVPTDGTTITASATGDLTLRGTTQSVTFDVEATFQNGRVGVLGKIPVVFADFGIPSPSVATITTEDNGLLEFVLAFDRA
ncbi:MAG TPA: YceI family protein [Ilumatobacteraceae bacterium]|nr:YceI family protein [Ilumatobacteraceae bacterium]HRC45789.1 YceI family protein [Ilumatobacteraceae bacterium]